MLISVLCSRSHKGTKCWLGLQSHLRPDWGRIHFQAHTVVGRIQFVAVVSLRASLLLVSGRPPSVPCHMGSPTWLLASSTPARESEPPRKKIL